MTQIIQGIYVIISLLFGYLMFKKDHRNSEMNFWERVASGAFFAVLWPILTAIIAYHSIKRQIKNGEI